MSLLPHHWPERQRLVRALRLRLPDADEAPRARIALEDGLGSADFGDAGRLVFVRRLALPAFASRFNGPAAARAIENSFRAMLPEARHGADARAAQAPIVWFDDVVAALIEALAVRVEGRPLDAWYWRRVDALFAMTAEPSIGQICERLDGVAEAGVSFAPRAVLFAELARRWRSFSAGGFERFIAQVPARWVESANSPTGAPAGEFTLIYMARPAHRAVARAAAPRIVAAGRVSPTAARWVAHAEACAAGELRTDASGDEVAVVVDAMLDEASEVAAPPVIRSRAPAPNIEAPREVEARPAMSPAVEPGPRAAHVPAPAPTHYSLPPWFAGARETAHAGLFLLLTAWRATGADEWLCGGDETRRDLWLDDWARRLDLPADDAQRAAWLPAIATPDPAERARGATLRRETRRWLRTVARLGPASLVRRAGAVTMTRTHLDVIFPMNAIDLRVRRMGLDADPGWVPWLGRIVAFHYVEAGLTT